MFICFLSYCASKGCAKSHDINSHTLKLQRRPISERNFSKVTSSMQRESELMPVPSNWCSLIEIMSYHRLWPSFRRNIHEICRSAIYFLHSFGILIFISRVSNCCNYTLIHWVKGEIKESRKYAAKYQASFSPFAFDSLATELDDYALLLRIISDRSFRFFRHRELFIAASWINYLFCARNFKQKNG